MNVSAVNVAVNIRYPSRGWEFAPIPKGGNSIYSAKIFTKLYENKEIWAKRCVPFLKSAITMVFNIRLDYYIKRLDLGKPPLIGGNLFALQ